MSLATITLYYLEWNAVRMLESKLNGGNLVCPTSMYSLSAAVRYGTDLYGSDNKEAVAGC